MADSNIGSLVQVSGHTAPIEYFRFLGDTTSVTINGFFVTRDGRQTGNSVSVSVPVATGSIDGVSLGTVPIDACGFIGNTTGGLRYQICHPTIDTSLIADFKVNYSKYPLIAAGNALTFGSVAVI